MTDLTLRAAIAFPTAELRPHPRNYREHPPDQIEHLKQSIRDHGFYRNVVASRDGTILAGHGVVQAATALGLDTVNVVLLDIDSDSPQALKLLAADNTLPNLALDNDRALTELLEELQDTDQLLGTGFDDQMLRALMMVTRPSAELLDKVNTDDEWREAGMPDYESPDAPPKITLTFADEEQRLAFCQEHNIHIRKRTGKVWSAEWGATSGDDLSSLRYINGGDDDAQG